MIAEEARLEPDDSVRQRLLQAAIALFNQRGYAPTTVREIVDAAGVTKPALYYYFGSKEGIYLAIMQDALTGFMAALDEPLPGQCARDRIIAFAQRVHALFREHNEVVRLVHGVFYGPHDGAPPFDIHMFHEGFVVRMQQLVSEGIACGELRGDEPEATLLAVMGAANVCMEIELAHPDQCVGLEVVAKALNVVFDGAVAPSRGAGKE
jgi:TetR/AcrR family transcriptional regulator